ncbi:MAG: hypothetical protein Q9171_000808 [Xanthocarpia ochracea]
MRLRESQRISPSHTQQLISEFLEATTMDPSLHPNALLTENGPVVVSSGSVGLVLHNLKRVEAGLRGEHLAADLTFKDFGGEGLPAFTRDKIRNNGTETEESKAQADQAPAQGWQDKAEYEREQEVEQGELGLTGTALETPILNTRLGHEGGKIPTVENPQGTSTVDRDERKRQKKEKRDQRKRETESQRAK